MSNAVEFQDIVDILRTAGFGDIVDLILDGSAQMRNGKTSRLKLARTLGVNPRSVDHRLAQMRELLAGVVA